MNIIKTEVWQGSPKMQEYARKESAYIVELSNGNIISLSKPKLETNFCFGFGAYAAYTDDEQETANALADRAKSDVDYFVNENMKQITDRIENLRKCLEHKRECYTFINYTGQPSTSDLMAFNTVNIVDNPECAPYRWANLQAVRKLDTEDIQKIIEGLEEVGKKFMKRLNTYLKKYGLEKLHVWTYCRD